MGAVYKLCVWRDFFKSHNLINQQQSIKYSTAAHTVLKRVPEPLNTYISNSVPIDMFKITTRPPASALAFAQDAIPETHRGLAMDLDDDLGEGPSRRVVSPGEIITSSKDYMRCVS
jgi:hypothetical protein